MVLDDLVTALSDFLLARKASQPFILGISGGQGAGKSTLCTALDATLSERGHSSLTLALDDFYLSKAARLDLAETVHPLCATRGVPGTHDVARLGDAIDRLATISETAPLLLPRFSKSHDDCQADAEITQRPDFVFLEGWCVGAHASCIAPQPQNQWEAAKDPHGVWKKWTHDAAQDYQPLWDKCDAMLLLRQENFDAVIDSRWIQEKGNAARSGVWQFETRAAVAEFCAHYRSWTQGIWDDLTPKADFTIGRNADYTYYHFRG